MKKIQFFLFAIIALVLSSCTNGSLNFNEMVSLSREEALKISIHAKFYQSSSTKDLKRLQSVFRGEDNSTIEIFCTNSGELKSKVIDSPYLEDEVIHLPVQMTLEEAEEKLQDAGYSDWSEVVLRRPLGPDFAVPLYIFTTPTSYIGVNTITGEVTPL